LIDQTNDCNISYAIWRLIMLDTDQLRSFAAIVDTGSFTRAAERVHKTQSAVSMQIRRLEEQLGRPLFGKHGRGVRLTEDGEKLIDYARQILQVEAAAFASLSRKALAGRLRFGIPDDYAETIVPEIVTRFVRRHPLVEISVVCDASKLLAERVASRELDMAVVSACGTGAEVLREERLRWVAGQNSHIHEARPLPMALSNPTCAWRAAAVTALDKAGIAWRGLLSSATLAAITPVVRAGLAVTVLPASAMRPGLRFLEEPETGLPALPVTRIGIVESRETRSAEARALAEEVRDVLRTGPRTHLPEPMLQMPVETEGRPVHRARSRLAAA
jgi:DNA-binding transcriptional LysR family regulator